MQTFNGVRHLTLLLCVCGSDTGTHTHTHTHTLALLADVLLTNEPSTTLPALARLPLAGMLPVCVQRVLTTRPAGGAGS